VNDLLVFDMDGVLVEVTESYRATIQATVKHFTGDEPTRPEIQDWKNRGGWNDDWRLSHRMIQERGGGTTYNEVVTYFQRLFLGANNDGQDPQAMILREQWVAQDGLFRGLPRNTRSASSPGVCVSKRRLLWTAFAPAYSAHRGIRRRDAPKPTRGPDQDSRDGATP